MSHNTFSHTQTPQESNRNLRVNGFTIYRLAPGAQDLALDCAVLATEAVAPNLWPIFGHANPMVHCLRHLFIGEDLLGQIHEESDWISLHWMNVLVLHPGIVADIKGNLAICPARTARSHKHLVWVQFAFNFAVLPHRFLATFRVAKRHLLAESFLSCLDLGRRPNKDCILMVTVIWGRDWAWVLGCANQVRRRVGHVEQRRGRVRAAHQDRRRKRHSLVVYSVALPVWNT